MPFELLLIAQASELCLIGELRHFRQRIMYRGGGGRTLELFLPSASEVAVGGEREKLGGSAPPVRLVRKGYDERARLVRHGELGT